MDCLPTIEIIVFRQLLLLRISSCVRVTVTVSPARLGMVPPIRISSCVRVTVTVSPARLGMVPPITVTVLSPGQVWSHQGYGGAS